jgi:hypothetical protein
MLGAFGEGVASGSPLQKPFRKFAMREKSRDMQRVRQP